MVAIALLAGAGTKRRTGETRRSGLRGGDVRIALLELKRSGPDAVRLRWRYRNESDQALNMELGAMGMDSYRFAKDVMLQDPVGNKYAVIDYNTPDIPAAKHDEFQFSVKLQPKRS